MKTERFFRALRTVLLIVLLTYGVALAPVPGSRRVTLGDLQPVVSVRASQGYWLVAADGGVFTFGDARFLGPHRNQANDIVGMARTPDGTGLWTVDDDGDVLHYGTAINYGSRLVDTNDIRGFAARPGGDGYWMVSKTGAVYAFGGAGFHGPFVPLDLNQVIVGMAATPSGNGYWHVARDGGIFAYGDAKFYGSTGAIRLNQPIVGMAATPSGQGYWLVASDGGIFSFGDARFFGSTGAVVLNQPIVAMAPTGTGHGYWLVASDGGVFSFGDASFHGSTGAIVLNQPIIGMVPTRVQLGNDFPNAVADSAEVDEDTSVSVNVLANDSGLSDGGVTVSVLEGPGHGSATVAADGRIVYTPAANYFGPDSLTYVVADADGDRSFATVSITVNSRNDAPAAPNQSLFTPEETLAAGAVLATDADGDPLTYSITGAPAHGTATVNAAGVFTYTPAVNYNGNDTFTITVSDGRGGTDTATIGMSVGSANDPPVAADQSLSTVEDTALNGSVIATDADGDSLTYSVTAVPAHGTAFVNALGLFTYTPALNYTGADAFAITVDDGHGGTDTATITVSVLGANDPPVAGDQLRSTNEDTVLTGPVGATDPDGNTLTYSVTGAAAHGTASVDTAGTFTYTPASNYNGADLFTITVSDGQGGTDTATINVTVNAVNDPPIANDQSPSTPEDTVLNGSVGATDVDGNPLTYSVTSAAGHGAASVNALGAFTYTPAANYTGPDSFTITVNDGQGGTDTALISVTVGNTNDPPVANNQSLSTPEETALNGSLGATDVDGDTLTYNVTGAAGQGTASVNSSGGFTYTPALNYTGPDAFTITVDDGQGGTDTATISVTVNPVNDAPVINESSSKLEFTVAIAAIETGTIVATDVDNDNLTFTSTGVALGTLVLNQDTGEYTYTALLVGDETFTVTVSDGSLTDSVVVSVHVTA